MYNDVFLLQVASLVGEESSVWLWCSYSLAPSIMNLIINTLNSVLSVYFIYVQLLFIPLVLVFRLLGQDCCSNSLLWKYQAIVSSYSYCIHIVTEGNVVVTLSYKLS